jgi:hypothetical protein
MKTLMAMYGKAGDIAMSMWAASLIREKTGQPPSLLVAPQFREVARVLRDSLEMPIDSVICEKSTCPLRDKAVAGSFMASWSEGLLRKRHPGFKRYFNCSLPHEAPEASHMAAFIAYLGGLCPSPFIPPRMPWASRSAETKHRAVFHFGAADSRRHIRIDRKPLEMDCVCVGGLHDPAPDWIDEDFRGLSLEQTVEEIRKSAVMVGSDSLMTHLSGLAGVPTACFHATPREELAYSRMAYACGVSLLAAAEGIVHPMLVREAVCRRLQV